MQEPRFVDVGGIRTRYFEQGTGEALVLIHGGDYGYASAAEDWELSFAPLSRLFHVFAFDKLGMGYTDNPSSESEFTIDASNRHAYEFLLATETDRAHLIGHSRGAFPATRIAIDHPEMVSSLVIVDSGTVAPDNPASGYPSFYINLEKDEPRIPDRWRVKKELEAQSYSFQHITDKYVEALYKVAILPKNLEAKRIRGNYGSLTGKPTSFFSHINTRRAEMIAEIKAGKLKVPTLILWGYNDPSAPYVLALDLYNLFCSRTSRAELHIFNKAGHYSFREHTRDFEALISSFCANR